MNQRTPISAPLEYQGFYGHPEKMVACMNRFIRTICQTAAQHGNQHIKVGPGLEFWCKPAGLALQGFVLLISLAGVLIGFWMISIATSRNPFPGKAVPIFLLPFIPIRTLMWSFKRRAEILRGER